MGSAEEKDRRELVQKAPPLPTQAVGKHRQGTDTDMEEDRGGQGRGSCGQQLV